MENNHLSCVLHLKIKKNDVFFGNGICTLLEYVDTYKSLNLACEHMQMAYSKAWKIIKKAEKELGFPLLIRQIGGATGGGSILSEEGSAFIENYKNFRDEVDQHSQKLFVKYFG